MVLTFPRRLPDVEFAASPFRPSEAHAASRAGRLTNTTRVRAHAWQVDMTTVALSHGDAAMVEAWWLSLRGGLRSCLFVHPHDTHPRRHYERPVPAETAGRLQAVANGNRLTVERVASGLRLSPGDRIGLERRALRAIGRVVQVSGRGSSRRIEIEPVPPVDIAVAGAAVRFVRPQLVMRPVPGSYRIAPTAGRYRISFSLLESRI